MKTLPNYTLLTAAIALLASMNSVASETTIAVTAENFSHAETARNYRNWAAQGANKGFVILERVMGIEPTSKAWEAFVLPLNYTRKKTRCDAARSRLSNIRAMPLIACGLSS